MIFLGNTNTVVDVRKGLEPIQKIMNGSTEIFNGIPTEQQYVFRQSAGNGVCYIRALEGKSLVWNQLVNSKLTGWSATGFDMVTGTDSITLTKQEGATTLIFRQSGLSIQVVQGHKYLLCLVCSSSVPFRASFTGYDSSFQSYFVSGGHITVAADGYKGILTGVRTGFADRIAWTLVQLQSDISIVLRNHLLIDLTLMFGEGNEPSTVAEFEALYNEPYYPYQPGVIKNNDAVAIESVGFNQWDEEWEVGSLNPTTGAVIGDNNNIRTKNFIPVIPGDYYLNYSPSTTGGFILCLYDKNGSFIRRGFYGGSGVFTVGADVAFIKFATFGGSYGGTYNNNICVNISDASRNGTYEPYWKKSIQLGLNAVRVKSHNIWDEEWEEGTLDYITGLPAEGNAIRSKNYTPILAGMGYYAPVLGSYFRVCFYDGSYNFISGLRIAGGVFTTPASARYAKFSPESYGTTYNHDICINESSSFNGQYEPYGDNGVITKTGGLPSAGSVYDEIDPVRKKYIKRIGEVDMGTLDWNGAESGGVYRWNSSSLSNKKIGYLNLLCGRYETNTQAILRGKEKTICGTSDGVYIYVTDSAYTTADAFKAAMNGVPLYYELATPVEYDLVDPIPNAIEVDENGTERAIFPVHIDGAPSAPFRCQSNYYLTPANVED